MTVYGLLWGRKGDESGSGVVPIPSVITMAEVLLINIHVTGSEKRKKETNKIGRGLASQPCLESCKTCASLNITSIFWLITTSHVRGESIILFISPIYAQEDYRTDSVEVFVIRYIWKWQVDDG